MPADAASPCAVASDRRPKRNSTTNCGAASETGFDSYALVQYLTSRSAIDDLGRSLDLRAMFARPEADWLARLSTISAFGAFCVPESMASLKEQA